MMYTGSHTPLIVGLLVVNFPLTTSSKMRRPLIVANR
ncbi:unknown [Bacteroides cellulosilyticus CAG:158]|jgi:hypothetical protein|nr:unknown [Bacteroides cellulosilyticus CAG:158]